MPDDRLDSMPNWLKAAYWLQFAGPRLGASFLLGMNDTIIQGVARLIGEAAWRLDLRHRTRAIEHLQAAGYEPKRARRIARAMFRHFATAFVEGLVLRRRMNADNVRKFVEFRDMDRIDEAQRSGRGALVVGCHQGHWELAGIGTSLIGYRPTTIVRAFRNPYLDRFVNGQRAATGQRTVEQRGAVRQLMRDLKEGRVATLLADQNAGRDGVFVPFFGRLASTRATPALLALKTGAKVLPFYSWREGPYRYVIGMHKEDPPEPIGNLDADVRTLTAWYTAIFEKSIRERPEQWLWAHRRWRSRPRVDGFSPSGK
jgi:KDO2-lipid IV(A) lauroyltransferase